MKNETSVRVLVAEDDPSVAKIIKGALEKIGYEHVGLATDGEQAVEMTRALEPDVILMDIKMPRLDGLKAARRIHESVPTPVVVLTAYDSLELVEKASESGVAAYLTKPAKPAEIKRTIIMAIARHKDLMELRRLNSELEIALVEIKTLQGILPICSKCKKIRDDTGYWSKLEEYLGTHSKISFSHSLCPLCMKTLYGDEEWYEEGI